MRKFEISLEFQRGKFLSEKHTNTLLKKECFVPKDKFEIREVMRIGTIFARYFWNEGIVHS